MNGNDLYKTANLNHALQVFGEIIRTHADYFASDIRTFLKEK
jgi:hypothetical protein